MKKRMIGGRGLVWELRLRAPIVRDSMNSQPTTHSLTPFSRLVHGVLLVVWLLSYQGIAPALMLKLEGDHTVKACSSQNGEMQVVLGHAESEASPNSQAQPSKDALAGAVSEAGKQDHVFFFKSVEEADSQTHRLQSDLFCPAATVCAVAWTFEQPVWTSKTHLVQHRPVPAWSPGQWIKNGMIVMRC